MRTIPLLVLLLLAACDNGKPGPDAGPIDGDNDGYDADQDCDDGDAFVRPGGEEVPYDGVDNDCDPATPDDDLDGDGYGREADCDEGDASIHPGAEEIPDDGIDQNCVPDETEDADGDGWTVNEDCDDGDARLHPDAPETCDGVDEDCDGEVDEGAGEVWYADADEDGFGDAPSAVTSCEEPEGYVADGTDCNDTTASASPQAEETCDELDNDCDGVVDDGVTTTFYADTDGDGWGVEGDTQEACFLPTGYAELPGDCDELDEAVNPDATEVCNDVDDDCDTTVDEDDAADAGTWHADADGDGYGDAATATVTCDPPAGWVAVDTDCDDTDASLDPDTTWYIDYDRDGYGSAAFTLTQCAAPAGYVRTATDCDDLESEDNPAATEVCDGDDDDCDGLADDDDPGLDLSTAETWYADTDGDGYGDASSVSVACEAPASHVGVDGDCDDGDDTVSPSGTEEWFDGVDSDCDGAEDPDACDDDPPASTVATDATCTWAPTVGSFNPEHEWEMTSFASYADYKHVLMAPMVGQLTDDDGDGALDGDDTPDIAFVSFSRATGATYAGVLRIVSGDGSAVHRSVYSATYGGSTWYPYKYTNIALGDVDGDGEPEIAATVWKSSTSCYAGVYETDGTLKWVYTAAAMGCRSHAPALADLEGDGDVEVLFGKYILDGATGALQATGGGGSGYYSGYSNGGFMSFAADLDGDGDQEVVAGSSVYTATGATVCSTGYTDGYPAAADLDGDGEGEFVVSGNGYVRVFDGDCSLMDSWSVYGGGYGGPPTIADYDGDGEPEIGLPGDDYYSVWEVDGTRLWANVIDDSSSHSTGSSVFDFDGDGAAEVVYADETALWVYDGATGTVLLHDTDHTSGTVNEYPVIADVDGDGNAEIVVPNDNTSYGVTVIGDADDNWVSARMVWNQHAYSITNVEDDLTIPAVPDANWPTYNSFRQGAPGSFNPTDAPNVYPVTYPVCQDACGADVTVYVQVANDGLVRASADTVLAVYGVDASGARTELYATTLGSALDAGELSAPWVLTFGASELAGYTEVVVSVDDDAAANECEEGDNEVEVDLSGVCE